jgi:hypothetical protein
VAPEAFAFVAGGTVQAGGGLYLERAADRDLLAHCRAGDFTYILTSRQMGKSSLMIRTAERIGAEGVRPVIIDLTEIGAQTTADQWYRGFLLNVEDQLGLTTRAAQWWDAHADLPAGQRFSRFFTDVVLAERKERMVVFVDEIDTTLRLNFTDDFFAAIRYLYQARASEPELHRLSFVLIGVATPGDLIKDAARTPFNVGHRIDLSDFSLDEALPLAEYLPVPESAGRAVMGWILRWTGGHPYLTLRVVRALGQTPPAEWTEAAIDAQVERLFFSDEGDNDSNLQFVRDMLTKNAFDKEAVLRTYHDIRRGQLVPDREMDQVAAWLKLSGVVCRRDGALRVRNPIYERVFDERWTRDHLRLYANWRRRAARALLVLVVLTGVITAPLAVIAWMQMREARAGRIEAERLRAVAEEQMEVAQRNAAEAKASEADAKRARAEAEASANKALATLQAVESQLAAAGIDDKSVASLLKRITADRQTAEKQISDRTSQLRIERDTAVAKLQTSEKEKESLREQNSRLMAQASPAQTAPNPVAAPPSAGLNEPQMAIPDLKGRDVSDASRVLQNAGLRVGSITRREESDSRPGTIVAQSPSAGTRIERGAIVNLAIAAPAAAPPPPASTDDTELTLHTVEVKHDSTRGNTTWTFDIAVNNDVVLTLPPFAYQDGVTYRFATRGDSCAVISGTSSSSISTNVLCPIPRTRGVTVKSVGVVGRRVKESKPLTIQGTNVLSVDYRELILKRPRYDVYVGAVAPSRDPQDGQFVFLFAIEPAPRAAPRK